MVIHCLSNQKNISLGEGLTIGEKVDDISTRVEILESQQDLAITEDINLTMANFRQKIARIEYGSEGQCIIGLLGDSWTQHTSVHTKYVTPLAKYLRNKYGNAGGGFYSFGISHIGSGDAKMESVDPDDASDTRIDRLQADGVTTNIDYRDHVDGTRWVDASDATFKVGAWLNLDVKTPHDRLVIHFYAGEDIVGKFTYILDGAAPVEVNTTNYATGHNQIVLDVPDDIHTLRFDCIEGRTMIFGVDMQRTNSGVRVHKLGNKGIRTTQFTTVDLPIWQQC